ncbi:hypothetical protein MY04_2767 [Flammeovirga sp. MY04]|uniref:hypothetical protein n=1 Tax=Flammeovirga sp. MY04 TaxID=1191459 RepID=UPI0008061BE1|nr:hypothetical protein [Flammeovirga sp. MY04]ANQ50135.1 hypothetical protein MY04_2767 [Flammeovirga sp. MY04]
MKKLFSRIIILLISSVLFYSCNKHYEEVLDETTESSSLRMPFNQQVYILNSSSAGSEIYEVSYDFQGLEDEAYLKKMSLFKENGQPFTIPQGGHMCVSPENDYLTVVVSRKKKIYLVDLTTHKVKVIHLFKYDPNVSVDQMKRNVNKYRFRGKITQVDVDKDGYLFLAGKSGFYKVVADWGTAQNGGSDIWNDVDVSLNGTRYAGQVWAHVVKFEFDSEVAVEGIEDEDFVEPEFYFEENTIQQTNTVKFQGGDILFTQNSDETDGFERQRLISFSQWQGGTAIYLNNMDWDWSDNKVSFQAGTIYGGLNARDESNLIGGRVTGAALTGDNMVFTSHHFSDKLQLRTLNGEIIKNDIKMILLDDSGNPTENTLYHNWGDMASTQSFDVNSDNPISNDNNREIVGEYYDQWYRGNLEGYQYAEVKLYRPEYFNYDVKDLSHDNYNVSKESRKNSANADLADFRKNANKFVSLGGEGGMVLMQLPQPLELTIDATLQVVETSWGKKAFYEDKEEAFKAYGEKAEVFVHKSYNGRYYKDDLENSGEWVKVGDAYIANNEFHLSYVDGLQDVNQISWIKIVDSGSITGDGFDVNFVAGYQKPMLSDSHKDKLALYKLYESAGGSNWWIKNEQGVFEIPESQQWSMDNDLDNWFGVSTNSEGRVTSIDLYNTNLIGYLPEEIGNLSELVSINIMVNQLSGELPSTLTNLTKLETLLISENQFEGNNYGTIILSIPTLQNVFIFFNNFDWTLMYLTPLFNHPNFNNEFFCPILKQVL